MANTTLYTFKANLQDLVKLQGELDKATAKLNTLKKTDKEYAAQQKKVKDLGQSYNNQTKAMAGATAQANKMNKAGGRLVNTFKSAAVAIAAAFAVRAIVGSVKSIISTFAEFEKQMAAVKAISGATGDEFIKLERTALKLGASTMFTATEVAKLQEEFARLGFTVDEIDAATVSTLNLAAATGESLANSAQIAGSTLRAFNLDAEQTQRVTDVMAQSFTNSALNLDRFKESMKFVAPVARATGFTLEETSSLLMQLADNGLSGSIAGNALKNIFLKLGDANSKLAKKLGGTVQGIPQLAAAMRNLSEEGFSATEAVDLLDKRSAPAFLALIKNIEGLESGVEILNKAEGAVNRMAAIRLDTLEGDFTILKSATEGLSVALGDQFDINLRNIIYSLTNFIQNITKSDGALKVIQTTVQLVAAALVGLTARFAGLGLVTLVRSLGGLVTAFRNIATATYGAAASQKALKAALASTPWGFILQVVTSIAAAFFMMGEEASEAEMKQKRLNDALNNSVEAILAQNDGTKERANAMRELVNNFPELLRFLDLERATNAQLMEIKKLMSKEDVIALAKRKSENEVEIEMLQKRIDKRIEEHKELKRQQRDANARGDSRAERELMNEAALIEGQKNLDIKRRDDLKEANKELIVEMNKYYSQLKTVDNLIIEQGETLRNKLKLQYSKQLNEFRKAKESEKEIQLQDAQDREQFLKEAVEYNNILAKSIEINGKVTQEAQERANAVIADSPFKEQVLTTQTSIQDLNIELSELRKFVSDLDSAFVKTADTAKDFGNITGFSLNKTKDQFKKLNKLFDDMIEERIGRQRMAIKAEFAIEQKANDEQIALMKSNQDNINSFIDTGSKEELASLIKSNKNKFDTIKNLTAEEYARAIDAEKGNKNEMIAILEAMLAEEAEKIQTANAYKEQLEVDHNSKMKQLEIEGSTADSSLLFEEEMMEAASLARKELQFFSSMKKRKDARVKQAKVETTAIQQEEQRQLNNLKALRESGKITEQEYQDSKTRIVKKAANERSAIEQQQFEENKEAAVATLEFISERYNMAFDAFSAFMSNRLALQTEAVNETYDLQSEELNDAMTAELNSLEGNQEAQEDVREHYRILQEANEAKKQEELTKIKKKEFKINKANDLIQAAISGALAIVKTAGNVGFPAILAAAPIVSTLVAAQIAAIASQKFVGALGGIIPGENKFAGGGMVVGPSHANGGVKFNVGGRVAELEGGEAVINKRSTAMFRSQLSAINEAGGGVKFADGGVMPGTSNIIQSSGVSNQTVQFEELAKNIVSGINSKQVTVSEADITGSQTSVSVTELTSSIF